MTNARFRAYGLVLCALAFGVLACTLGEAPASPTPRPFPSATPSPFVITATVEPSATATTAPPDTSGGNTGGGNTGAPLPNCSPRSDWPTYIVQPGDTLSSIARRANTSAEVLQAANCLSSPNVIFAGTILRVPVVPVAPSPVAVFTTIPGCANAWFFSFAPTIPEASTCPGPIYNTGAAGQDFEGGRAYYYAAINSVIGPSVYIIYNDGTWERYDDTFNGNVEPASDPSIVPPSGRYQPVRAIGKVWRQNQAVRSKLGWAFAPENDFAGRRQFPVGSAILFIDHGIRNTVLRLDNTTARWSVAGTY
jgi:LysM repeat protein